MNILEEILLVKHQEVEQEKALCKLDLPAMKKQATVQKKGQSFISYLENNPEKMALIAEVKKASPSKGLIRADFDHAAIAKSYVKADVGAISVLTDEKFFQGHKKYFTDVREITDKPLLRKDFIVDEFQVYQTKLMGADMLLLIVSALEKDQLKRLFCQAKECGLDVLVETHDEFEFERAMNLDAKLIGINNRNLKTFETKIDTTIRIINEFKPDERFIISESGIVTNDDVQFLKTAGASGILVGQTLMRCDDIEEGISKLLGGLK